MQEHYQRINEKYYGPSVNSDSEIRYEWTRIPPSTMIIMSSSMRQALRRFTFSLHKSLSG